MPALETLRGGQLIADGAVFRDVHHSPFTGRPQSEFVVDLAHDFGSG